MPVLTKGNWKHFNDIDLDTRVLLEQGSSRIETSGTAPNYSYLESLSRCSAKVPELLGAHSPKSAAEHLQHSGRNLKVLLSGYGHFLHSSANLFGRACSRGSAKRCLGEVNARQKAARKRRRAWRGACTWKAEGPKEWARQRGLPLKFVMPLANGIPWVGGAADAAGSVVV